MTRAQLLEIAALGRSRERERQGRFLVEGVRAVESAIQAGAPIVEILASSDAAGEPRVREMLDRVEAPVWVIPARDVERVSDARTSQGLVAVARSISIELDASHLPAQPDAAIVVLDTVQDPGNVGTIIRTAAWFGLNAVIAGPGTADLEGPKVVRAAAGGLWDIQLMTAADLGAGLDTLADAGFSLCGADSTGQPLESWTPTGRVALVLGGEANGLSDEARTKLSSTVGIPRGAPTRATESLNVAVAAGVLMQRWRTTR